MSAAFKASSTLINDTGSGRTVPWPANHKSGDYALLTSTVFSNFGYSEVLSTPAGFTLVASYEANTGGIFSRTTVWYCVATSSSMASPVIQWPGSTSAGATGIAQMHTFSGALNAAPDASNGVATTVNAISIPSLTTSVANDLIVAIAGRFTSASAESISGWANANLANVVEYADGSLTGTSLGTQQFALGMATGIARSAGAIGATSATWASTDSYPGGGAIVVALKPAATTTVTKDSTSGRYYPASDAEFVSLTDGDGIPAPRSIRLYQEASGNVVDVNGVINLTSFNVPSFHNSRPSNTRFAIGYHASGDCHYAATNPAGSVGDISNVSSLVFGVIEQSGSPSSVGNVVNFGASPNDRHAQFDTSTTPKPVVSGTGQTTGTGANSVGAAARPYLFKVDRTNAEIILQNDLETVAPAYSAPAGGSAYLSIGWDASGGSVSTQYWFYQADWGARAAEWTTTQRASFIDRHLNGPRVASITASPSSATISTLGGTQAVTATGTLADASTKALTSTATWLSSAPSVATVNSSGVVTAVANGTAIISCTYTSLNAAQATSNNVTITVSSGASVPTITKITVTPAAPTIIAGQSKQATAIVTYSDASTLDITNTAKWATTSASIASVSSKGLIEAVSAGVTGVTATPGIVAYPITAAAMAAAVGYGTWGAGYMLDETTGSLNASFGAPSLALTGGSPLYLQQGPLGAGDYGIGFVANAGTSFSGGNVFNVAGTDDLVISWIGYHASAPTSFRTLFGKGTGTTPFWAVVVDNVGTLYARVNDGTNTYNSSIPLPVGVWYVGMMIVDRGAAKLRLATVTLDGVTTTLGTAVTIPANAFATANNFLFGACVGVDAIENSTVSAFWINTGSGVASTMNANASTAVNNLRSALAGGTLVTTAPYLSSIDHIAAALSRLPSQFQKTKIQNLIRSFAYPAQELEQAMWAVLTQRSITNAIGAQLDVIGGIVGQDRNGMNDDDYRRYISARVAAERSQGVLEDLYSIAVLIVNDTTITFSGAEEPPATLRFTVIGGITDQLAAILYYFLHLAVGAGVRLIVQWSNVPDVATFTLDIGPGLDSGNLSSSVG